MTMFNSLGFNNGGNSYKPYINYTWQMLPTLADGEHKTDGVELVINGNFDTDSDLIKQVGWTIANGVAIRSGATSNSYIGQTIYLESGVSYQVKVTANSVVGTGSIYTPSTAEAILTYTTTGTHTAIFTPSSSQNYIIGNYGIGSAELEIDNISVQKVTQLPNEAYSKNSGTSKVPLKLYSGNPLDFQGTQSIPYDYTIAEGDTISFGLTSNIGTWSSHPILGRSDTGTRFYLYSVGSIGASLKLDTRVLRGGADTLLVPDIFTQTSKYSVTVYFSGGFVYSYIDGELISTVASPYEGLSFSDIGANLNRAEHFDGQLDYLTISNSILTPAQIQKQFQYPNEFYQDMVSDSNTLFATDFRGNGSNIRDDKNLVEYPIINYSPTQRTNFTTETNGLRDLYRSFDSNGFFVENVQYLNCIGEGKATNQDTTSRTSNITLQVNPIELGGNILSGGVNLDTTGLNVGVDNDIVLSSQVVNGEIELGVGFKGKITKYTEDLIS